jgi:Ser/Thr protein kinase RdoA (MazF antagonist)
MYTNFELWKPTVEEILRVEKIPYEHISLSEHPGTHAVFQIDDRWILKVYTPLAADDFYVEDSIYESLEELEQQHIYPKRIASGQITRSSSPWNYIVISMISGKSFRTIEGMLSEGEKVQLARDLASAIREYHSTPLVSEAVPEWSFQADDHLPHVKKKLEAIDALSKNVVHEMLAFLQTYELPSQLRKGVVHADVTEDHVYLSEKDGQWTFSGLIDVADSKRSYVYLEFPAVWFELFKGDVQAMNAFLDTYDDQILLHAAPRNLLVYTTLIHQFGTNMIRSALEWHEINQVNSFEELIEIIWPKDVFR